LQDRRRRKAERERGGVYMRTVEIEFDACKLGKTYDFR
jgi:hypothetical protein